MTRRELLQSTFTNFQADKDLLTSVYQLHEFLGATKQLPEHRDKKQQTALRAEYFNQWLNHVIIRNNKLHLDIPIGFIFVEFSNNLMSAQYDRRGNNIASFAEVMRKAVDDISRSWIKYNKPQELPEKKGTRLENLSDDEIINLYTIVTNLGRDNLGTAVLFSSTKADSYFNRLADEYKRRFVK